MKAERHIRRNALLPDVKYPVIITDPRFSAGFSTNGNLFDIPAEIPRNIQRFQQWSANNGTMLYRKRQKYRQPEIRAFLVFHRAADEYIIVSASPVRRKALFQTVDALGEKIEPAIASLPHHLPAFLPPAIGVGKQKVRRKAGHYHLSRCDFVASVAPFLQREPEAAGPAAQTACLRGAIHLVLPVNITVFAPRADFRATVPGIPVLINAHDSPIAKRDCAMRQPRCLYQNSHRKSEPSMPLISTA